MEDVDKINEPQTPPSPSTDKPIPQPEKLEIPKGKVLVDEVTLSNILARLQSLEGETEVQTDRAVRILNRTARVRFVDEEKTKVVTGYGKSWEKNELGRGKFLVIQVHFRKLKPNSDGEFEVGTQEVEYVKFMEEGAFSEAEIIDVHKEEVDVGKGSVNETRVDYNGYRTEETGKTIPLKVIVAKITYKLKFENGEIVELPEAALN